MVHPVGAIYYDPFWLYAAGFFAVACGASIGKWIAWAIEYGLSERRWKKARRKAHQYWVYMIGFGFAAGVSLGLYIFQH